MTPVFFNAKMYTFTYADKSFVERCGIKVKTKKTQQKLNKKKMYKGLYSICPAVLAYVS